MALIHSKDTKPEMTVRKLVHSLGFRYRLHVRDLPGRPDLVFRSRSKVIFVHGCFWHMHSKCRSRRIPSGNYWPQKLAGNRTRDQRNRRQLAKAGWKVLVVWECEMKDRAKLSRRLAAFLDQSQQGYLTEF